MNVVTLFVPYTQTALVKQPRESGFHDPAVLAQTAAVFPVTPRDPWGDAAITQRLADLFFCIVCTVRKHRIGTLAGTATRTATSRTTTRTLSSSYLTNDWSWSRPRGTKTSMCLRRWNDYGNGARTSTEYKQRRPTISSSWTKRVSIGTNPNPSSNCSTGSGDTRKRDDCNRSLAEARELCAGCVEAVVAAVQR